MKTADCVCASTPWTKWNKELYPPGEVFGEITDSNFERDGERIVLWLAFKPPMVEWRPWMCEAENYQVLERMGNEHRIVFDGSVRIDGRQQPRDAIKVRDAILELCNSDSDLTGYRLDDIVGGGLMFRCRQVKEKGVWKERWSVSAV
jgi:hypothetical protein